MINTHQYLAIFVLFSLFNGIITDTLSEDRQQALLQDRINEELAKNYDSVKFATEDTSSLKEDNGFDRTFGNTLTMGKYIVTVFRKGIFPKITIPAYTNVIGSIFFQVLQIFQALLIGYGGILIYDKMKNRKQD